MQNSLIAFIRKVFPVPALPEMKNLDSLPSPSFIALVIKSNANLYRAFILSTLLGNCKEI